MASPMEEDEPRSPDIQDRLVASKGEDEEARLRRKLLSKRTADSGSTAADPPRAEKKKKKSSRHSPVRAPEPKSPPAPSGRRVAMEAADDEESEGFSIQPIAQEKEKHRKAHKDKHRVHRHPKRDRYEKERSPRRDERSKDHGRRLPPPPPPPSLRDYEERGRSSSSHRRDVREPPPSRGLDVRSRRHLPPPPVTSRSHDRDRDGSRDSSRGRSPRRDDRRVRDVELPRRERELERGRDRREVDRSSPTLARDERHDDHVPRSPPLPESEGSRVQPLPRAADSGSSPGTSSDSDAESGELSADDGERRQVKRQLSPQISATKEEADEPEGRLSSAASSQDDQEQPGRRKNKSKFESSSENEDEEEQQMTARPTESEEAANGTSPLPKDLDGLIGELEADSEPEPPADDGEEEVEPGVVPTRLLPVYFAGISGCRSVEEFHCLNRIEEGTYGVVYRAKEKRTDEIVALKRLKMEKEKEGFPITSLREINMLLKAGGHENVVNIREIVVGTNMDKIYLCMDYVEHDMKTLMESVKQPFLIGEVKTLLRQLLAGIHHLHDNWILHRDLKTSNLLLSHTGELKIGDFGLAREYGSPIKPYTPIVVTLWYRAPELLLGTKEYSTPIDMWSVGCIFAEFLTLKPIFPGRGELDELNRIFKCLGTPSEKIWPGYDALPAHKKMSFAHYPYNQLRKQFDTGLSDKGLELMNKLLTYNPNARITAKDAMKHPWFTEDPQPVRKEMFPTWPAKSELKSGPSARAGAEARGRLAPSPKPPSPAKAKEEDGESEEALLRKVMHLKPTAPLSGFSLRFDAPKFK